MASVCKLFGLAFVALLAAPPGFAAQPVNVEQLCDGLDSPVAVAVRPSQGDRVQVCVADAGAGRVVIWDSTLGELSTLVAGPPEGEGLAAAVPSGLEFLNAKTLVVAWANPQSHFAAVAIYQLADDGTSSVSAARGAADEKLPDDSAPLVSLHRGERYLYTMTGDGDRSILLRARHNSGMLGAFRQVATLDGPGWRAVTTAPTGYLLAAGGRRLLFLDPAATSADPSLGMATGLQSIRALAYGPLPRPSARLLYALESASGSSDLAVDQNGLYRLDSALDEQHRSACRAVLIAPIENPTALAFGLDGAAYVTTQGDSPGAGRLLKISGEL